MGCKNLISVESRLTYHIGPRSKQGMYHWTSEVVAGTHVQTQTSHSGRENLTGGCLYTSSSSCLQLWWGRETRQCHALVWSGPLSIITCVSEVRESTSTAVTIPPQLLYTYPQSHSTALKQKNFRPTTVAEKKKKSLTILSVASALIWKKHYFSSSVRENPFNFLVHSVLGLWQGSQKAGSYRSYLLISLVYLWIPDMQGPVFNFNTWYLTLLNKTQGRLGPTHLCNFHVTKVALAESSSPADIHKNSQI